MQFIRGFTDERFKPVLNIRMNILGLGIIFEFTCLNLQKNFLKTRYDFGRISFWNDPLLAQHPGMGY